MLKITFSVLFAGSLLAQLPVSVTIPLERGDVVVKDMAFIRLNKWGDSVPILSYRVENRTPFAWTTLKLHFDISGKCNGTPAQWEETEVGTLGSSDGTQPFTQNYEHQLIQYAGKVNGCSAESFKVKLIFTENDKYQIDGVSGEHVDLAKRAAAAAAAQRKIENERRARVARENAEKQRKAEAERAILRARCFNVYRQTSQKRVADVTVEESRQIRACEALDMYPPK